MSKPANSVLERHTPGPWSYHSWQRSDGTRFGIETADHRHGLGSIAPNENASTLLTMEQHEANARLIAAAPELLEALRELTRWVDIAIAPNYTAHRPMPEMGEKAMEVARALIRKAEGTT